MAKTARAKKECPACAGDGETWDGKEPRVRKCEKCGGTGTQAANQTRKKGRGK